MKKHILPNIIEFQIEGITIASLFFNVIMSKSETAGKANMQSIKNKIQALDLKIKVIDIDHFHEHVNSLYTSLKSH